MAVSVQGDSYACVAKHLGNYLGIDIFAQQQRGARVPEIVKLYLRKPRVLEKGLESVRGDVATVQWLPSNFREFLVPVVLYRAAAKA